MCLNFSFGLDDNRLYWSIHLCPDSMADSVCLFLPASILGRSVHRNSPCQIGRSIFFLYRFKTFKTSAGRVPISLDPLYNSISDITVVANLKKNVEISGSQDEKKRCIPLLMVLYILRVLFMHMYF